MTMLYEPRLEERYVVRHDVWSMATHLVKKTYDRSKPVGGKYSQEMRDIRQLVRVEELEELPHYESHAGGECPRCLARWLEEQER